MNLDGQQGRVVMVDIIDFTRNVELGDYNTTDRMILAITEKLCMDKPIPLIQALLDQGFTIPVLVAGWDGKYVLINGHHRLCAALFCGFTEIPVFVGDGYGDWGESEDINLAGEIREIYDYDIDISDAIDEISDTINEIIDAADEIEELLY